MKTQVLKPGLLVSLKTGVRGGVNYQRVEIEPDHATDDGARVARWETRRHIPDPVEFEAANVARGKCRAVVSSICCPSSFGLLCPASEESKLQDAIEAARDVAREHNAVANLTRVEVYVLVGRVAQDDAEAARAIGAELRDLLEAMQAGIKAADPAAIREAANKAKAIGAMLSEDVSGKVDAAITEARKAARELVKRVEKDGMRAADVVAFCSVKAIEAARFAFLDLDEGEAQPEAPRAPNVDLSAPEAAAPMQALSFSLEFA